MSKMNEQEASEKISDLIAAAYNKIFEAEAIADESGVSFSFGLSYGMGGTYFPKQKLEDGEWKSSDFCSEGDETGWKASSISC